MMQGVYDQKLQNPQTNNNPLAIIKVDPKKDQVLYIQVKASLGVTDCQFFGSPVCNKEEDKLVDYMLQPTVYGLNSQIPYEKFMVGENGLIMWSETEAPNTYEFKIRKLYCEDDCANQPFKVISYKYQLFVSKSYSKLNYLAKCTSAQNQNKEEVELVITYSESEHALIDDKIVFRLTNPYADDKDPTFYVQVVAYVLIEEVENNQVEVEYFNFYYNSAQVRHSNI